MDPKIASYAAFDGSPLIEMLTNGFVKHMDLALHQTFNRTYDWVVSLNVGQFIPKQYEDTFVDNVVKAAGVGVIMHWGHWRDNQHIPNPKDGMSVLEMFSKHGFTLDDDASDYLVSKSTFTWLFAFDGLFVLWKNPADYEKALGSRL